MSLKIALKPVGCWAKCLSRHTKELLKTDKADDRAGLAAVPAAQGLEFLARVEVLCLYADHGGVSAADQVFISN